MPSLTTQLYIVRHAVAEDAGPDGDDRSRRLTPKGRKRFARMVRRLIDAGLEVDVIASSPLVRCHETAEILAEELLNQPAVITLDALAPSADWQSIVEWTVQQDAAKVAWVSHSPCVGRLVAEAIGDGSATVRFAKGAIASIALGDGLGQPGELQWLVTPDLLGRRDG
jgi:phosphohistidine phosphatase